MMVYGFSSRMSDIISELVCEIIHSWTLISYLRSGRINEICKFASLQVALTLSPQLPRERIRQVGRFIFQVCIYYYMQVLSEVCADLISIFVSAVLLKSSCLLNQISVERSWQLLLFSYIICNIIKIIIVAICIVDDRYLHRITMVLVWGTPYMIYGYHDKTSRRRWMQ